MAAALASALLLAACARTGTAVQSAPAKPPSLMAAARTAAVAAAGGTRPGGTLHLMGELTGAQLTQYLDTLKPFEDATGIHVAYESTSDLFSVLQSRIAGGNPPDLVSDPSAGQMRQLARDGKLVPVESWLDMAAVRRQFPAGLLSLATVGGRLYGLFYNTSVQNLVWYDPKRYTGPVPPANWAQLQQWARQQAAAGRTPWCTGLASGTASGWPGAAWIEQFVLRQSGTGVYDAWWQGRLPWTSPQIRSAFQAFGQVAADPAMVTGGPTAVLTTTFDKSPQGLYANPPRCYLTLQADWLGNALAQEVPGVTPGADIDFFTFPAVSSARGGDSSVLETSGELIGAFRDSPQTRAFIRYLAAPQFAALVASTGQWLAANRSVTPRHYSSSLSRRAAQAYADAGDVRFSAQAAMPPAMETAFFSAVLDYVRHPDRLDSVLAGLDRTRLGAYRS